MCAPDWKSGPHQVSALAGMRPIGPNSWPRTTVRSPLSLLEHELLGHENMRDGKSADPRAQSGQPARRRGVAGAASPPGRMQKEGAGVASLTTVRLATAARASTATWITTNCPGAAPAT